MQNPLNRMRNFLLRDLWSADRSSYGKTGRFFLDASRLAVVVIRDFLYGQVTLWAMGLVYTTLMSLVPLLAVSFSVLKAFGVQNKLEPFLLDLVAPLGANGPVVAHRIVEFVNNMRVGVLGVVGLGLLMFTVMSLIQKIEQAFNAIWRVRGQRSVFHQFTEYLSVVIVGPVLVVSALALTATLMSTSLVQRLVQIEPLGSVVAAAGKLVPYVLVCASFTFLYLFLPNIRVRWSAAAVGGVIGGVVWQTAGWGFASFIVASTKYAAIYSSFAILILFIFWLYLSWLILLIGCEVSFYYQNPHLVLIAAPSAALPDARFIEQAALSIMFLIASHYYHGKPPWTVSALAQRLGLGTGSLEDSIAALKKNRLIIETADDPPAYIPARDLETIALRDVYDAVRRRPDEGGPREIMPLERVDELVREIDRAVGNTLEGRSLKDLVRRSD